MCRTFFFCPTHILRVSKDDVMGPSQWMERKKGERCQSGDINCNEQTPDELTSSKLEVIASRDLNSSVVSFWSLFRLLVECHDILLNSVVGLSSLWKFQIHRNCVVHHWSENRQRECRIRSVWDGRQTLVCPHWVSLWGRTSVSSVLKKASTEAKHTTKYVHALH